jgi:hypothetical protein
MKSRFFASMAILGLTAIVFTGCSKMPQAEIDATNMAIEQAKSVGADVYVHDSFMALQDSMNSVMVMVEAQNSKLIKNYAKAKEQLAGVSQFASEVQLQAETRIEEVKAEIQSNITEVKALIDSNRQLCTEAPKGKEGTSALMAIKAEIDAVETSINESASMFESGDYAATLDKTKAAKEKASAINTELSDVIAKYKANVKKR